MAERIKGPIYEHKKTKRLLHYLPKESIVFLWHEDLDGVAVEGLIEAQVKAVINGKASMSGQYTHHHVNTLLQAGIAVFDVVNLSCKNSEYHGEQALIQTNKLFILSKDRPIYAAELLAYDQRLINEKLSFARLYYAKQFDRFVDNTLTYAKRECEWFQKCPQFPTVLKSLEGKDVFIIARNTNYEQDICAIQYILKQKSTIVIAVDGAADGLLKHKICPNFIIGDMDSISEKALHCGAILLCHEHPNGHSPGKETLMTMGIEAETIRFVGTSEDVAVAASYWSGAKHLYLIGCRMGMTEFLEKSRAGMGATWLCRMQAGERITDLKGIHKLINRNRLLSNKWISLKVINSFRLKTFYQVLNDRFDRLSLSKKKEVLRHD
ncbi:putative cytokinetic ring protein SteA [Halalkalibacter nanhaiisediminis]|uniref:Putative membrane-anchored protein n=1 Tax=Halalkalibacter nanhaiisediminis TaxID=688079 RepID=A0A562QGQ1_9BACI|nr:putative cytokinetic ring protein SteA [Halalkalibacter nanhaiisediminis]TWI55937.1 putative membrane-anchored protein [Halalkalibacter nanhaiisediminis]